MRAESDPRVEPYKSHTSDAVRILVLPPERRDDAVRIYPSPGKQEFFWGGRRGAEDAEKARIVIRMVQRPARTKRPSSFHSASSAPLRPPY